MEMTTRERKWADLVGRAMVPAGLFGGTADDVDLGAEFAEECAASPWYVGLLLRASLLMTWLAPVWRHGRLATFAGVGAPEREEILEELLEHPVYQLRLAAMYLKITACSVVVGRRGVLEHLGAYGLQPSQPAPAPRAAADAPRGA